MSDKATESKLSGRLSKGRKQKDGGRSRRYKRKVWGGKDVSRSEPS